MDSHYELHLEAVREVGVDTFPVTHFIERLRCAQGFDQSIQYPEISAAVRNYVSHTLQVVEDGDFGKLLGCLKWTPSHNLTS